MAGRPFGGNTRSAFVSPWVLSPRSVDGTPPPQPTPQGHGAPLVLLALFAVLECGRTVLSHFGLLLRELSGQGASTFPKPQVVFSLFSLTTAQQRWVCVLIHPYIYKSESSCSHHQSPNTASGGKQRTAAVRCDPPSSWPTAQGYSCSLSGR